MKRNDRLARKEEMFEHLRQWKDSGKSRKAYCQEYGLALPVFGYWQTKSRKETDSVPPGFIHLKSGMGLNDGTIELYYPNGVRLVWRGGSNPAIIKMLISLY
jgi:hypothetical protein